MADKELRVNINSNLNATGFTEASKKIGELKTNTDILSGAFGKFAGIAAALGAITLFKKQITQTLELADSFKLMEGRLSLVAKGTIELANAQEGLFKISQNTSQSY